MHWFIINTYKLCVFDFPEVASHILENILSADTLVPFQAVPVQGEEYELWTPQKSQAFIRKICSHN